MKITDNKKNIRDFLDPLSKTKTETIKEDEETTALPPNGELLRWHCSLGQLSFSKMITLMLLGILPHKLLKVRPLMCACCKIGTMTK